jgi:hypothetical protein
MRPGLAVIAAVALVATVVIAPARAWAQAEAAPPEYVPPGHEKPPPPPSPYKWHIAVEAELVAPIGARPSSLPPVGWGASVQLSRALVDVGRLRFGLGASFAYHRVQDDIKSTIPFGNVQQYLAHMTFAGLLVLDGIFGRLHPWLGAGAGVSVAQYSLPPSSPSDSGVSLQEVVPLIQIALGLDVEIYKRVEITLAAELDPTFSSRAVGTPPRTPFAPGLFVVRHGVGFRF